MLHCPIKEDLAKQHHHSQCQQQFKLMTAIMQLIKNLSENLLSIEELRQEQEIIDQPKQTEWMKLGL